MTYEASGLLGVVGVVWAVLPRTHPLQMMVAVSAVYGLPFLCVSAVLWTRNYLDAAEQ
ncbi:hypothetical protein [Haloferax sp. KTX1]|uniref:hypothetical protein n=1 Tax=Haloferax sp. KTX1 TaxID=2600597 RepID=UPI00165251D9|nr:hypothetical protein [Haloferax sp. KTX1]